MAKPGRLKIGVVAPASRLDPAVAKRVTKLAAERYGDRVALHIHPQCALSWKHFAGDDAARAGAFLEVANDPSYDVLWFARGGYGSCRIVDLVLPKLTDAARAKIYLGYSDAGSLLAGLMAKGFKNLVHGPMPADIARDRGESAVLRALSYLVDREPETIEPAVKAAAKNAAFNLTILSQLIGTPYQPDLSDHVLMLEEVSEHMYRIDRTFFHVTSNPAIRRVAGIRLGRCSLIPPNDPDFGQTEEEVARHWCKKAGIAYLGRADIGHDVDNKIVPFSAPLTS